MSNYPNELPNIASYKPSVYYFRKALRGSSRPAELREIGLTLCDELEHLKEWVRAHDLKPPRFHATIEEAQAKGYAAGLDQPDEDSRVG